MANLALAYARSEKQRLILRQLATQLGASDTADLVAGQAPEDVTVFFERLNTEGHNLHPCGRGRLGQLLCAEYPKLAAAVRAQLDVDRLDPTDYVFVPVHTWQLAQVVRPLLADEIADRTVVPVPAARLTGVPTSSVRTLLTERSPAGRRLLVKTALDVLIGSTRRSVSAHTTNNGPVYARLLLPVSVILTTKYGVAVEAHLQNCIVTFVDGVPTRLVLRDWGGMRIYPPRLRRQGLRLDPQPGAVTVTDDVRTRAVWQHVRAILEGLFTDLAADPALHADVATDRAVLLGPTLPIKAFARMRLNPAGGDQYVPGTQPTPRGSASVR